MLGKTAPPGQIFREYLAKRVSSCLSPRSSGIVSCLAPTRNVSSKRTWTRLLIFVVAYRGRAISSTIPNPLQALSWKKWDAAFSRKHNLSQARSIFERAQMYQTQLFETLYHNLA